MRTSQREAMARAATCREKPSSKILDFWRSLACWSRERSATMNRNPNPLLCVAFLAFGSMCTAALANDSTAELSVGGLVFTRSAEISVESAELTITPEQVSVRYVFLNQTQNPATVTVAFPLPDIDLSEADNYAIPTDDPVNFVAFQTKVDGKVVSFTVNQRGFLGDKDISPPIKRAGLPLLPILPHGNRIAELPKESRDRLINEGLLIPAGTDAKGQQLHAGSWTVKTAAVRQQTFPAGKPVVVEHRYRTSMGVSFDTILRKGLRDKAAMEQEGKRNRSG